MFVLHALLPKSRSISGHKIRCSLNLARIIYVALLIVFITHDQDLRLRAFVHAWRMTGMFANCEFDRPLILRMQRMAGMTGRAAASRMESGRHVWVAPALQVFSALMAAVRQYRRVFG
ncbi:hypothetical protein, partial [uncultured Ruegeria sp.]|uniref:hypothetical protein n=1 Tax=uncultured Ruegeria sp. TaxID=259304 RepID=UPI002615B171